MKCPVSILLIAIAISFANFSCTHAPQTASAPILILANQENFGLFIGEILKAEGLNEFTTDSLSGTRITSDFLNAYDIVILAEGIITQLQQQMLSQYVKEGGNLIAFRPDKKLYEVFGVRTANEEVSEGYMAVVSEAPIANGITREKLQYHGSADIYQLTDGKEIARLFKTGDSASITPAVVQNHFGNGEAIAFAYNLAQSIVFTRQGNFQNAGQEKDGILGIRAMDLFTDGWVDTTKNIINQADEQMRLLSHCIQNLNLRKKPLPHFWYFPDSLRCLVTLNNDGEDSKEAEFVEQFGNVAAKTAKMTLYIKEVELVSRPWVDGWIKKGFEISGHPDDTRQATRPDWATMDSVYKNLLSRLRSNYGISGMQTVTNHWFVWVGNNADGSTDFAAQARIEENNGIGLDCNYAHYDNGSGQGHFLGGSGLQQGNYTGSGLPMKFADVNGRIVHVYQQLNNVYDQQYMEHKDPDGYFSAFRGLMDRSLNEEVYSTISVKAHNNEYYFSKVPLMKMLDYAASKQVPVWTEQELLEFLRAKDQATFSDITWAEGRLAFQINSSVAHANGITCLLPFVFNNRKIKNIRSNGEEKSFAVKTIKGIEYAWLTVKPGQNYRLEVNFAF